nr:MAG TPA: hypothetical protein [Caudoviricetes sp.]
MFSYGGYFFMKQVLLLLMGASGNDGRKDKLVD